MVRKKPEIYRVTTRGGVFAIVDGQEYHLKEGDLIRAGHSLIDALPNDLTPADDVIRFDVEDATAEPGKKRGE